MPSTMMIIFLLKVAHIKKKLNVQPYVKQTMAIIAEIIQFLQNKLNWYNQNAALTAKAQHIQ